MKKLSMVLVMLVTMTDCVLMVEPYEYTYMDHLREYEFTESDIVYESEGYTIYEYEYNDNIAYYDQRLNNIDKYVVYALIN